MIGRNVHAYVDDMVITSEEKEQHIVDLEELFSTIDKYNLKLNQINVCLGWKQGSSLASCSLTGYRSNSDKCATIIGMRSPASVKEVQQLTGRMAALSRFLSAREDKGYLYFQCLKKNNRFVWTHECEDAFVRLKEYLASSPFLCKPLPSTLFDFISQSLIEQSARSLCKSRIRFKRPIYFVSKVL